jgi:hypothetical protein
MAIRPLFIFSPMRAGSTLVQRVLAADPAISTASEPWILLPLVYSLREDGARAEYWHQQAAQAIADFCRQLPAGEPDYWQGVHDLALELYTKASADGATYFLDKTPHYHFIAPEIMRLFPEGKFVFLWRNPLAVLASYIENFRGGRWQPHYARADIVGGLDRLVDAWEAHAPTACAVRFEDLVSGDAEWRRLFAYLELPFDPDVLSRFAEVDLEGRYGDPTGTQTYRGVSREPVDKWTRTINGLVREAWCRRYLRRIGAHRLGVMGYEADGLLQQLPGTRHGLGASLEDLAFMTVSLVRQGVRDAAVRVPETPFPIGPTFRPLPPLHVRLRARVRRMSRAWRSLG